MKKYKKISIIGTDGSGKTTLARRLGQKLSMPVIYMDSYIWGENWTLNDKTEAGNKIKEILQNKDLWIAEGYMSYAPREILELADLVIYLNYTNKRAVFHNIKRWLKHRKNKREELPEGCEERLSFKSLYQILRGDLVNLIEKTLKKYPPRKLIRIKSPEQLEVFINENF
jgi:adenylate kinase family enzyme